MRKAPFWIAAVLATVTLVSLSADKRLFTDAFTPAEFAARRARVMATIGDGVAIVSGAIEQPNWEKFKQNKAFFYLCGIEVPRAILIIDGRTKTATAFIPARTPAMDRSEGPVLAAGEEAKRLTGLDAVLDRAEFDNAIKKISAERRNIYMPFREESVGAVATDRVRAHERAMSEDPWDGRKSKEAVFRDKVQAAAVGSEVVDLDPVLDRMRLVKSPGEVQLIREATRIASLGIAEGIRAAEVGMYEYEVEAIADYIFKRNNAMGIGYFALVASGKNAAWPHYHQAQARLENGDLVLFDYAPEFKYYTSDVTRMFPANGKFSPRQREMYGIYVKLYQALMSSIGPGPADARLKVAYTKMAEILKTFPFKDEKVRAAATAFAARYERGGRSFGHGVGLEVHDVGGGFDGDYKPGMVFTIEPALTIGDESIYIRLEDVILITATGYENLSGMLPMEPDAIEKLMTEPSVVRK